MKESLPTLIFDRWAGRIAIDDDVHLGMFEMLPVQGLLHGRLYRSGISENYDVSTFPVIANLMCKENPNKSVIKVMDFIITNNGIPTLDEIEKLGIDISKIRAGSFYYEKNGIARSPLDNRCGVLSEIGLRAALRIGQNASGEEDSTSEIAVLGEKSIKEFNYYLTYTVGFLAGVYTTWHDGKLVVKHANDKGDPAVSIEDYEVLRTNLIKGCGDNPESKIIDVAIWVSTNKLRY